MEMRRLFQASIFFWILTYLPFFYHHGALINSALAILLCLNLLSKYYGFEVPKKLVTIFIPTSLFLVWSEMGKLVGLAPGVAFLTFMALLKTFEMKEKRDFYLFVLVSELMLVAHLLTVDSLSMVAYVLFVIALMFYMLLYFHLNMGGQKIGKKRMRIFYQICLQSIPLAAILFFAFPRLTIGNLFYNTLRFEGKIGFTDKISPGEMAEVAKSDKTVFRATFSENKIPAPDEMYWRGGELQYTDGFKWKFGRPNAIATIQVEGPAKFNYQVDFDLLMDSHLFFLEHRLNFKKRSKGFHLSLSELSQKMIPVSNEKIRYSAQSGKAIALGLSPLIKKNFLQLPDEVAPRFKAWTSNLNRENLSFREKVNRFSSHILNEEFSYTLSPGRLTKNFPLDEFFFESRKGFCEHYASTLAIYLRLLGVPARVVVGFQGGVLNPVGKYLLIRHQDAHAWVEAWQDKKGWVRLDPVKWIAPERVQYGAAYYFNQNERFEGEDMEGFILRSNNRFLQRLKFAFDMYYYEYNRKFVNYDFEEQKKLFRWLGTDRNWRKKLLLLIMGIVGLPFVILGLYLQRQLSRLDPWKRALKRLKIRMARKGVQIADHAGPRMIRQQLLENSFQEDKVHRIMLLYESGRYACREVDKRQNKLNLKQFDRLLKQLRKTRETK